MGKWRAEPEAEVRGGRRRSRPPEPERKAERATRKNRRVGTAHRAIVGCELGGHGCNPERRWKKLPGRSLSWPVEPMYCSNPIRSISDFGCEGMDHGSQATPRDVAAGNLGRVVDRNRSVHGAGRCEGPGGRVRPGPASPGRAQAILLPLPPWRGLGGGRFRHVEAARPPVEGRARSTTRRSGEARGVVPLRADREEPDAAQEHQGAAGRRR